MDLLQLSKEPITVIAKKDVDIESIGEITSYCVNYINAPKIKELIDKGWVLIRVQTEVDSQGHCTVAYLVKLR